MSISFLHVVASSKSTLDYLENFKKSVSHVQLGSDDQFWVNLILDYINGLYSEISQQEKTILKNQNERCIKEFIRRKLETNENFGQSHFLIVELEPQNSHPNLLGFYDIKIRSSLWNNYFAFECKCLTATSKSISEYVYNAKKEKNKQAYPDGGVYRFLINKYAKDKSFGGMIGFIQSGNTCSITKSIIDRLVDIKLPCGDIYYGELIDNVHQNSELTHYFKSVHTRYDIYEKKTCLPIDIHHFLYDFTC